MSGDPLEVAALGVRIRVGLDGLDDGSRQRLRTAWARAVALAPAITGSSVDLGEIDTTTGIPYEDLASHLSSRVTVAAIKANAGSLMMLHAAGLAEPGSGRTIAFVGPSGRGKTTLARALGAVWDYVTDETVAFDPVSLDVQPHPKPLSLKVSGARTKEQVGPDELGLGPTPAHSRLARVVLLDRDENHAGVPTAEPCDIPTAVGILAAETSFLTRWDDPLSVLADALGRTGGALRVRYREATELVTMLPSLLELPGETSWERVTAGPVAAAVVPPSGGPRWRRADVATLRCETSMAVLTDRSTAPSGRTQPQVAVLTGIGPLLWDLADAPRTRDELVAGVVEVFGTPEGQDPVELVSIALASLVDHGVLTGPRLF